MNLRPTVVVVAILTLAAQAVGQSFNIDLDIMGGPPELGNGVPSDAFGGAANQPGRWNRIPTLAVGPIQLVDLSGAGTTITYSVNNYGGGNNGSGIFFPGNTGDYSRLLNDVRQIGTIVAGGRNTFRFSGLSSGDYDVYTYAVRPYLEGPGITHIPVTVWEAATTQTQIVTGPMPGNAFAHLVTHSNHRVTLLNGGDIHVDIIQPPNLPNPYVVNGFQIVLVPEPATWIAILTFSAALCRKVAREVS